MKMGARDVEKKMSTITTGTQVAPVVSLLKTVFNGKQGPTLHQAKIDKFHEYDDFEAFVRGFVATAVYPTPQASKTESYGWTPVAFEESEWRPKSRPDATPKRGLWRVGHASTNRLTLHYGDIDNDRSGEWVSFEEVCSTLRGLGLSYLAYTSYSHLKKQPGQHKVRFVLPVSRVMSYDEARAVAVVFHEVFRRQSDLTIFDPGDFLYGPPHGGEIDSWVEGQSLDVDKALALFGELPDEAQAQIRPKSAEPARPLTPEESRAAYEAERDKSIRADISIRNEAVFNPGWFNDLYGLSQGGSHRQTLLSLLSKVHVKTSYSLSFGELRSIQRELDAEWGFYCERKYGKTALEDDVKSVLHFRGTQNISNRTVRSARLEANLRRFSKKF